MQKKLFLQLKKKFLRKLMHDKMSVDEPGSFDLVRDNTTNEMRVRRSQGRHQVVQLLLFLQQLFQLTY